MRLADPPTPAIGNSTAREIASAVDACREALENGPLREVTNALRTRGISESDCVAMVEQIGTKPEAAERIAELRTSLSAGVPGAQLEQCILLHALVAYRARLTRLAMGEGVLRHLADELRFLAEPPPHERESGAR